MKPSLVEKLSHPRAPFTAVLVGVFLLVVVLGNGLGADDHLQRARLLTLPTREAVWSLFSFFPGTEGNRDLIAMGYLPWWGDPDVKILFFRPLSALTHVLDYALWPDAFWIQHAHSLLWYALGATLVALLYRRVLGAGAVTGLAALLFAIEDAHATPVSWLANRNALLALVFGALGVLGHIRWRETGRFPFLLGSMAALVLGLLAGEATLGMVAYVVAWELCLGSGGWARRMGSLVPAGILVVAWRVTSATLGFGVQGSGLYLDPGADPLGFAVAVLERGPIMLLAQWLQVPIDAWVVLARWQQLGLTGLGLVSVAFVAWLLLPVLRADARARFFAVGMLLAVLPTCAAFPMDRQLVSVGVGALGLLALLAARDEFYQVEPAGPMRRRWILAKLLLFLHAGLLFLYTPFRAASIPRVFSAFSHIAQEAPQVQPGQVLFFVNGIDLLTLCVPLIQEGQDPTRIGLLTSMLTDARVTRVDARTLEIVPDGGFLQNPTDRFARGLARPFAVGDTVARPGFQARVEALSPGGRPARVRFTFERDLEDPGFRWIFWKDHQLQDFPLPAVGETVTVERSLPGLG